MIDFKTENYFSGTIQFVGIILVMIAVTLIPNILISTVVLLSLSLLLFTSHYRLAVSLADQSYFHYLWILGMKNGDRGKFEKIDCLFIRKAKVSQNMNLRVASSTLRKRVYEGYIRFSEDNKVHLMTRDNKDTLITRLRPIAKQLNVGIIDYSEPLPKEM